MNDGMIIRLMMDGHTNGHYMMRRKMDVMAVHIACTHTDLHRLILRDIATLA